MKEQQWDGSGHPVCPRCSRPVYGDLYAVGGRYYHESCAAAELRPSPGAGIDLAAATRSGGIVTIPGVGSVAY